MRISITTARAQFSDLLRRCERGEEIVVTRRGQPIAHVARIKAVDRAPRHRLLRKLWASAKTKASRGPCAARSQDFLYDEYGLPK